MHYRQSSGALATLPASQPETRPTTTFGAVKRTYAPALACNDPRFGDSREHELDAWARRVFAANGFGDADAALVKLPARASSVELARLAIEHNSHKLAEIVVALGAAAVAALRGAIARWKQRRSMRETMRALAELDARTLRDIGLDRGEAASVAAEIAGLTDASRVRARLSLQRLSI